MMKRNMEEDYLRGATIWRNLRKYKYSKREELYYFRNRKKAHEAGGWAEQVSHGLGRKETNGEG